MTRLMVVSLVLVLVGCATVRHAASDDVAASVRQTENVPRGTWSGTVWETPASLVQGIGRLTLTFAGDGTWTGEFGKGATARKASGVVRRRGDELILDGDVAGGGKEAPQRVHLALRERGNRLGGVGEAIFSERPSTAMVDLGPVAAPAPSVTAPAGERGEQGNR
jgi:hypothetical protein